MEIRVAYKGFHWCVLTMIYGTFLRTSLELCCFFWICYFKSAFCPAICLAILLHRCSQGPEPFRKLWSSSIVRKLSGNAAATPLQLQIPRLGKLSCSQAPQPAALHFSASWFFCYLFMSSIPLEDGQDLEKGSLMPFSLFSYRTKTLLW